MSIPSFSMSLEALIITWSEKESRSVLMALSVRARYENGIRTRLFTILQLCIIFYNTIPRKTRGETCGEVADRQTAAVCPASSATLFRGEPLRKAVRGRPLSASGMYCTQAPYNRR